MTPIKVQLQLDSNKFLADIKNAVNAISGIEVGAKKAAFSIQNIEASSDKAAAGLNRAARAGGSFASAFRDIATITGVFSRSVASLASISSGPIGNIIRVNSEMERLNYQMLAMATSSGSIKEAAEDVAWLREEAKQAPFSLKALTETFMEMKAAQLNPRGGMLKSFENGLSALGGTDDEQLNHVSNVITQMASKSVIHMEDLQQLGQHMPNVMQLMARSMGVSVTELSRIIETGTLDARSSLQKLSEEIERTYDGETYRMMQSFDGQIIQFKNNLENLSTGTGGNAFFNVVKQELIDINSFLKSDEAKAYADQFGQSLGNIALTLKNSVSFIWEYRDALMAVTKVVAEVYAIDKFSQIFGGGLIDSVKGFKKTLTDIHWGLTAISDGFVGLKTGQSVFTSLRLGAIGLGTALKGVTASIPLIGVGLLAIQGFVELFLDWESAADKAKKKTEDAYEAAKSGATRNYEETKRDIDAKIELLKKEEEIAEAKAKAAKPAPQYINSQYVGAIDQYDADYFFYNRALQESEKQKAIAASKRDEIAKLEIDRPKIEADKKRDDERKGVESVNDNLYSRNYEFNQEYRKQYDELEKQRDAEIANSPKTNGSIVKIADKYAKKSRELQKKRYEANIAVLDDLIKESQDALKRLEADPEQQKNDQGRFFYASQIEEAKKQKNDNLEKIKKVVDPTYQSANQVIAQTDSEEKRIENGNKTLLELRQKIFDIKSEVSGAKTAFGQMFAQISAEKFGNLNEAADTVRKMHQEMLQAAGEKTVFDKLREGIGGFQSDLDQLRRKNDEKRIQNVIRRIELERDSPLTDAEKLEIQKQEGKYFGVGDTSVIEKQFNELGESINREIQLAAAVGNAFREDAFGDKTVSQIDKVKTSLGGVVQVLSNISGAITSIDIGSSLQNIDTAKNNQFIDGYGSSSYNPALDQFNNTNTISSGTAEITPDLKGGANLMSKNMLRWGDPRSAGWYKKNITTITTKSGHSISVHKDAAPYFLGFLNELEQSGYRINSVGGYNLRNKRNSNSPSEHAFGNAIDVNPLKNPMGKGFTTDMPLNISDMAAKYGLSWGGDWKSVKDPMHFEWTGRRPFLLNNTPINNTPNTNAVYLSVPNLNLDGMKNNYLQASPAVNSSAQKSIDEQKKKEKEQRQKTHNNDLLENKKNYNEEVYNLHNTPEGAGKYTQHVAQSMKNNGIDPKLESSKKALGQALQQDRAVEVATQYQQLRREMARDELKLKSQIAEYNKKAANPNYQGQSQDIKNILLTYDQLLQKAEQLDGGKETPEYKKIAAEKAEAVRKQSLVEVAERKAATAQETQVLRDGLLTQSQLRQVQLQRDLAAVDEWAERMRANGASQIEIFEDAERQKANIRQKYAEQANPLAKQMREWSDVSDQIQKAEVSWMDSLAGGISGIITGTGNLRSVIDGILNDITKIAVKGMLSTMFGGQKGKGGKGLAFNAKSMFTKSGAVYHNGGLVGNRGLTRSVSALAFLGAPKFHTGGIVGGGLLPSEVPIIAQKGEGVFTPDQMRAMGGFQQNQSVQVNAPITVNGSAGTPDQNEDLAKRMSKQLDGTMRAIIADEMRKQSRPGSFLNNRSR